MKVKSQRTMPLQVWGVEGSDDVGCKYGSFFLKSTNYIANNNTTLHSEFSPRIKHY
jgi:hypothetical protein